MPPRLDDLVLAVPSHGDRRRIVEVLGGADDLKAVLRALLHAKGVRQGFSDAVLDEAAAVKGRATRPDHGRRDLTALPTFTIDPDTARDFDDAISVAREGAGYRAHVHIADVSYFVDDDGEIEREARRRTSSLYLPLFAEPMLPAALSSDLCSLVPRQPRKCVTVEFTFDAAGRRTAHAVLPLADQQRPPPHLRLRRHGHRPGRRGRGGRRGGRRRRRGGRGPARRPQGGRRGAAGRAPGGRTAGAAARRARRDDAGGRRAARAAAAGRRARRGAAPPAPRPRRPHHRLVRARVRVRPRGRAQRRGRAPGDALARAGRGVHARRQRGRGRVPAAQEGAHALPRARAARAGEHARAPRPARGARRAHAAVPGRRGGAGGPAGRGLRPPQPPRRPDERPRAPRPARLVDARSCARSSRRATRRSTSATSAWPARRTCTSRRRSAATRTS